MSVREVDWVFRNSPYTLGARLVHLALADVANDANGHELWMHQAAIAGKARLSVSQVGRILAKMTADGYLELVEQGVGRGNPSRYRLILKGEQNDGFSVKPSIRDDKTPHPSHPDLISTKENLIVTPRRKYTLTNYSPEEEEVWSAYPKRPGNQKKTAILAYREWIAAGVDHHSLLAATKAYAEYCKSRQTDPEYILLGQTFFGPRERWRDYLPVERRDSAAEKVPVLDNSPEFAERVWREHLTPGGTQVWFDSAGQAWYDPPSKFGIRNPMEQNAKSAAQSGSRDGGARPGGLESRSPVADR